MDLIVDNFIEKLNEEQLCKLCIYNEDCSGGITSDGNGSPIYPPCSSCCDYLDMERVEEILDKARRKLIMGDYDEYLERQEEMHDEAVDAALETMNNKKEDDVLLHVGIKKDWLVFSIKQIIQEYAYKQIEDVKREVIASMKEELINNNFDKILKEQLEISIKEKTDLLLDEFLNRSIQVSNGSYWGSYKEIPIREFVQEKINNWIHESANNDLRKNIENIIDVKIKNTINDFHASVRKELNEKIDSMFNQTTKNVLSDTLFSLLTQNETYRELKASVNNLLEDK